MIDVPFQQLDRYEILARLSEGAYGEVYAACLRGTADFSTLVAIKVLHAGRHADGDTRQAFADEARLGGRLIHPNIARVIEFLDVGGRFLLVMELVDGVSFVQLILHQGPGSGLGATTVMELVAQACDGLHHAHEARDDSGRPLHLVHRDIKPSNLMLDRAGLVKVMDFGIAKVLQEGRDPTQTGIIKGTPAYMAPEVARGERRIDRRADLFALGVVAWELLMGERLYTGTPYAVLHMAAEARLTPQLQALARAYPPEVVEVVTAALAPEVAARFSTADEMGRAFRQVGRLVGDGIEVRELAAMVAPPPVRSGPHPRWGGATPSGSPAPAAALGPEHGRRILRDEDVPPTLLGAEPPPAAPAEAPAASPRAVGWPGVLAGVAVAMAILAVTLMLAGDRRARQPGDDGGGPQAAAPGDAPGADADGARGVGASARGGGGGAPVLGPATGQGIAGAGAAEGGGPDAGGDAGAASPPPAGSQPAAISGAPTSRSAPPPTEPAPQPRPMASSPPQPAAARGAAQQPDRDPPRAARGAVARLTFNTAPEEQAIWIDGRRQERPTPWVGTLSAGQHRIAVGDERKGSVEIDLSSGEPQLWLGIFDGKGWAFERIRDP